MLDVGSHFLQLQTAKRKGFFRKRKKQGSNLPKQLWVSRKPMITWNGSPAMVINGVMFFYSWEMSKCVKTLRLARGEFSLKRYLDVPLEVRISGLFHPKEYPIYK